MTNTLKLDSDQVDALRKYVRRMVTSWQPSTATAVSMVRAELVGSVESARYAADRYPNIPDYKKSQAISQAYVDFLDSTPVSFFE